MGKCSPALRRGGWGASCLKTPYIKTYKNQRGDPARKGWGAQRLGNNCISHTHLRKKLDFMRVSGDFFFRNFICFWYHITSQELKVVKVRKEKTGCISTPGLFLILIPCYGNLIGTNQRTNLICSRLTVNTLRINLFLIYFIPPRLIVKYKWGVIHRVLFQFCATEMEHTYEI